MNINEILWQTAASGAYRALPILSFPAAQKMHVTVEQLVKDSELQAQAMTCIAEETNTLAAVSLMDLSVEAEAFGANVIFSENEVPVITGQLICDMDDANALAIPDLSKGRAKLNIEAIRLAKERIQSKPVLAGMIGPYSLAGRLMDVTQIMYICFDEPEAVHAVLEKATAYLIQYGTAIKAAGADGILMAEPLAGILSPAMAEEFSVPYVKKIIEALQDDSFGVIYHNCGNSVSSMLEEIFSQGAAAYHFGNAVDMEQVLKAAPSNCLCMGNVDPAAVISEGTPEMVTNVTKELLQRCRKFKNFVPSSGCDIPAAAKWDNLHAFFAAVESTSEGL